MCLHMRTMEHAYQYFIWFLFKLQISLHFLYLNFNIWLEWLGGHICITLQVNLDDIYVSKFGWKSLKIVLVWVIYYFRSYFRLLKGKWRFYLKPIRKMKYFQVTLFFHLHKSSPHFLVFSTCSSLIFNFSWCYTFLCQFKSYSYLVIILYCLIQSYLDVMFSIFLIYLDLIITIMLFEHYNFHLGEN